MSRSSASVRVADGFGGTRCFSQISNGSHDCQHGLVGHPSSLGRAVRKKVTKELVGGRKLDKINSLRGLRSSGYPLRVRGLKPAPRSSIARTCIQEVELFFRQITDPRLSLVHVSLSSDIITRISAKACSAPARQRMKRSS